MNSKLIDGCAPWLDAVLALFYPNVCQHCRQEPASYRDGYLGDRCRASVQRIVAPFCDRCGLPFEGEITTAFQCANCREMELHFEKARSVVAARGVMLEVVHRYKYDRALWFERFLAGLLVEGAATPLRQEGWDLIVPVPLHPRKEHEREFNQATRLAVHLGRAAGLPVRSRVLRRVLHTRTQTLLSRKERAANMRRAFALIDAGAIKGRRVVLVDDVLTTGATTSASARVLLEGGATAVCVWTVARGLLH